MAHILLAKHMKHPAYAESMIDKEEGKDQSSYRLFYENILWQQQQQQKCLQMSMTIYTYSLFHAYMIILKNAHKTRHEVLIIHKNTPLHISTILLLLKS